MSHKDDELEEAGYHEVIAGAIIDDENPKEELDAEDAEVLKVTAAVKDPDEEDVLAPLEDDDEDGMPPLDMGIDPGQYPD